MFNALQLTLFLCGLLAARSAAQPPQDPRPAEPGWTIEADVTWHAPAPDGTCSVQVWHYPSPTIGGPELLTSLTAVETGAKVRVRLDTLASRPAADRDGFVRIEIWAPSRHGGASATIPVDADPRQPLALTCQLAVHAATTIRGRALDHEGRAVAQALVHPQLLPIYDDVVIPPSRTDHEGWFYCTGGFITDQTRVSVQHPQLGHASRDLPTPKDSHSHTELGDLTLAITHPRFLTLLFPDRTPIASARVQLGHVAIETDAAGRAPLHHLGEERMGFQLVGHADSAFLDLPEGDTPFVVDAVRARLRLTGPDAVGIDPGQLDVWVIAPEHGAAAKRARTRSDLGDLAVYHQPDRGCVFAAPGAWLWIQHVQGKGRSSSALVQLGTESNEQTLDVRLTPPE